MKKYPIFVHIFQHLDDHISRESALACQKVAKLYAKYKIKADFWPITLSLQNYLEKAPEVIETLKELDMPISYHTVLHHPIEVEQRIKDLNWDEAVEKAMFYESHWYNPLTGEYDPEKPGGIALIKKVFGKLPLIAVGSTPHLYAQKKLGARMSGIGFPLRWRMGLLGGKEGVHHGENTVVYMPNQIISQTSQKYGEHSVWDDEGSVAKPVEILKHHMQILSRDKPNIIVFPFHPFQFVFPSDPGWSVCYRNWIGGEGLPAKLWTISPLPKEETDKIFKEYEEIIAFIVTNPEFKVVTSEDILNMVVPLKTERTLSKEKIKKTADFIISDWMSSSPPEYIDLGDEYLSLADSFQALVYSLEHYADNKTLPEEITIREILGPTDTPLSLGIRGQRMFWGFSDVPCDIVSSKSLLATAKRVASEITDRIPGIIKLEGRKPIGFIKDKPRIMDTISVREGCYRTSAVNPAEVLYLMAQGYQKINQGNKKGPVLFKPALVSPTCLTKISVKRSKASEIDKPQWFDILQDWTVKPAEMKPLLKEK